jgi:hypothetical protein
MVKVERATNLRRADSSGSDPYVRVNVGMQVVGLILLFDLTLALLPSFPLAFCAATACRAHSGLCLVTRSTRRKS